MRIEDSVRLAHSTATNARAAAQEFYASVVQPEMALVLFFCSPDYDLNVLAGEMNRLFAGIQVVGCTTAGEIGPSGYREHSLTGVSFSADACISVVGQIDGLQRFGIPEGQAFCQHLLQELGAKAPTASWHNSFAFLLVDGLSTCEEVVARALQNALGQVPLVGGSAADGLNFGRTYVFSDGSFRPDRAALILITTPLPFKVFKTQHFVPTARRLVITKADSSRRTVGEINGFPAAEEYARLIGADASSICPKRFATSPVVVLIGGNTYVRSIQKANPDSSITFFCAIEEGLVLRVAKGVNLLENLEQAFSEIQAEIGPPQLVLGCDCVLRKLEIAEQGLEDRVARIFQRYNAVGFNTYGEQFHGVHVNQTLSGVALGRASGERNV